MTDYFLRLDLPERSQGPQQTAQLLALAKEGDTAAREKLISNNLRLVVGIARRFASRGYEFEDLFQIGTIGLMKAVDKFDPSYNVQFSTYAVPMIIGEIRRFIRDDNPVKVSRALKETAFKSRHVKQRLGQKLGREPTISEIAAEIGINTEELVAAQEAIQPPVSLSDPIYQDGGSTVNLEDRLAQDNNLNWLEQIMLKQAMQQLTPREQYIIQQRFFSDRTQSEVAKDLNLSQVQVSRLEKQILLEGGEA
jgi:RNA polymerase sporulation-specific sigma factor